MPLEKGTKVGHYELVEKLGEGGMGVVWKARDSRLGRDVAIKFLPEALQGEPLRLARIEREARAVAALNHPNIVTIHSFEEVEGTRFITMEMVDGRVLSGRIPPGGMPLAELLELAIPIADAVATAHERGIIHRDLKPANILVTGGGQVKILDFGLAKIREPKAASEGGEAPTITLSREGGISGTVAYMSPEQLRERPVDHRSDLFSLGVVLYEMATGGRPFPGETVADVTAAVLKDAPVPVTALRTDLPRELGRIIAHCLEKDPRLRLQSAGELRNELEDLRREPRPAAGDTIPSIAVLPFADMSREMDQGYFCDGMAEEIINALSKVRGMRVASRTSAFRFRDSTLDTREIGRELRVDTLLEGSVRKEKRRLRINVQLLDAANGDHLWSQRYDRDVEDVFSIQDEIAQNVVSALEVTLSPGEKRAVKKAPTSNVQAYDYYLRGRKFFYMYGKREIEFALQLFTRAIELDPSYARAYAGVADCWSYLCQYAEGGEASREQAEAASRRALELDADLAEAHASRGVALSLSGRDVEAERAFENGIRLDPRLFEAHYFYARHCFTRGNLEKAARLYEQAGAIQPEDYQSRLLGAGVEDALGRRDRAETMRREGIRLAEEHVKLNPEDARAMYMAANGLVALGERERGLAWADRALAIGPQESMLLYNIGCIRSLAGEVEGAIECLEKAVAAGLLQLGWIEHDTDLDPLRGHPRFQALIRKLKAAPPR